MGVTPTPALRQRRAKARAVACDGRTRVRMSSRAPQRANELAGLRAGFRKPPCAHVHALMRPCARLGKSAPACARFRGVCALARVWGNLCAQASAVVRVPGPTFACARALARLSRAACAPWHADALTVFETARNWAWPSGVRERLCALARTRIFTITCPLRCLQLSYRPTP